MSRLIFLNAKKYMICLALLLTSTALSAQPHVDGNTISWPDDGWYQVQNAVTYESLCEGGRNCRVPDSSYIVINHSSGQRYEGIAVPAQPSSDGIVVVGNTISWPDSGWYQIQNAASYESLCQGKRSCEVPDGTYIVINHSSGQRFEGVVVPQLSPGGDGIVVEGNTISWPDDGWYQVQNAVSYESLCQGGRECEVPDGFYIVINHTTGVRYENLVVEGDPEIEVPADPQISAATALPLLQAITAVINEKAVRKLLDDTAAEVSPLYESWAVFPMPQPLESFAMSSGPSGGQATDYIMALPGLGKAYRWFDYACFAGGDMDWYVGPGDIHDMVFERCVVGDAIYNGTAFRRMNTLRGEYPTTYYFGYGRTSSDGQLAELTGQGRMDYGGFSNLYPLDFQATWNDLQFSLTANGTQQLQVSDYAVSRVFEKLMERSESIAYCNAVETDGMTLNLMEFTGRDKISGQFDVSGDWSDGNVLSVELDLTSLDSARVSCDDSGDSVNGYDPDPYELAAWTGQIQVDAADGSSMTVRPVSDSETGTNAFVIDLDNSEQLGPVDWSGVYAIETRPWGERPRCTTLECS